MVKYYENYDQANMVYQESLDKLTPDRLMKFIKHHHDYQRPRLVKLDRYYKGFNPVILDQDTRRHEKGKADHRITHSFGKYIADFQTSYSVGNPINVKTETDDAAFDKMVDANDVDAENYDLFLDMTRYGRAYELVYRGEDNTEHLVRLDPLDTFVVYSQDVDPQPIMAVRYHQIESIDDQNNSTIKFVPEYWTTTNHITFMPTEMGGNMKQVSAENIVAFPVTEFKNSNFRLGDFETVIPAIDAYDGAQSDTANYMTDLNEAMLVIQGDIDTLLEGADLNDGIDPTDKDAELELARKKLALLKEMKDANMLLIKSGFTTTGTQTTTDAKYIHKEYDVQGAEAYKKRLANDIHKFSHTPDLTDENFASNASGVAMQYKVLGTVELASTKRRMFERGLYQRYKIIAKLEKKASSGWNTDVDKMKFTFRDNLPTDDVTQIKEVVDAGATLPQAYFYKFLPGINDPDEIKEMLKEQSSDSSDYQLTGGDKNVQANDSAAGQGIRGQTGQTDPK